MCVEPVNMIRCIYGKAEVLWTISLTTGASGRQSLLHLETETEARERDVGTGRMGSMSLALEVEGPPTGSSDWPLGA